MLLRKGGLSLAANGRSAGIKFGEAEVKNFSVPAASDEKVSGFDIAMDDIFEVRRFERIGHIKSN